MGYTARACLKFKRKKKKAAWWDYLPASPWETEQGPGGPTSPSPELWVGAWLIVDLCARGLGVG